MGCLCVITRPLLREVGIICIWIRGVREQGRSRKGEGVKKVRKGEGHRERERGRERERMRGRECVCGDEGMCLVAGGPMDD